ncbi:glycosyl transferase group 1 [Methanobacterium lacus]|uniref:Glycosyl transferase group 1 n=1 Tax=Methanobacterium lacus (strain AL-21) TaxID=877455 RepID=F0T7I0_METLA|nr:glycosyltransferase family 4 protein [Methanobacterium lacus]ADZ09548.1 glycosyl transferase group 1 [Methanobacterium lacus]
MKIAVFHNLPSGGAKRALYGTVDYLIHKGHNVEAYLPSTANEDFLPLSELVDEVHLYHVKNTIGGWLYSSFKYVPPFVKTISLRDLEATQRDIAGIINDSDHDVVLCEQDQYTLSPFFLKYIKKPTVYYCQQPTRDEAILKKLEKMVENQPNKLKGAVFNYSDKKDLKIDMENAQHAKYILANSYFSRESILKGYGLNSYVSYLGIDTNIFRRMEVPVEDHVLSVGTITPTKGYDFLIKSLSLVKPEVRPKLIIAANHSVLEWKNYIVELAKQLDVNLEIMDMVDDEKLVELYNTSKLVLYAPYLEPFGLVPIEAMGCGTPVIGVKEGGVRETVLENQTGILVERDPQKFADAITQTLNNPTQLYDMGRNGIKEVERFWTLEHAGERIEKHLENAIKTHEHSQKQG